MIWRGLVALAAIGLGQPALAACDPPFMGCTFNNGAKSVSICVDGDTATYAFGPTGEAPDLALRTPIAALDYQPWPGVGRTIFESVTFYNHDYSYTVISGVDRMSADDSRFSEVIVKQNEAEVAVLICDPDSVRWTYSPELADAKAALNLCWSGSPDTGWIACD